VQEAKVESQPGIGSELEEGNRRSGRLTALNLLAVVTTGFHLNEVREDHRP